VVAAQPDLLCCCFTVAEVRPAAQNPPSTRKIDDRVRAIAEAGYRGMGFYADDLVAIRDGVGFPAVRQMLEEYGIRHCQVEMLFDWWLDGPRRAVSDKYREVLLQAMEELAVGESHLKCGPDLTGTVWPAERYAESFAELAEQTHAAGGRLGLEFLPFCDVASPGAALAIVEQAAHNAGGIVIDAWHVQRGGTDYSTLRAIPPDRIVLVELDDAEAQPRADLGEDTVDHRRLCGEGGLELPTFVEAIRATGYAGAYGVEILSSAQRALPLEQAARESFRTARAQFDHVSAPA
jgi:sugar phosphate isomerase/epimerase